MSTSSKPVALSSSPVPICIPGSQSFPCFPGQSNLSCPRQLSLMPHLHGYFFFAFIQPLHRLDDAIFYLININRLIGNFSQGNDRILSSSRSIVSSSPFCMFLARWAAVRTKSNRFGIFSIQSSTVTRAIVSAPN